MCVLTTSRLLWYRQGDATFSFVENASIVSIDQVAKGFTTSAKISLGVCPSVPAADRTDAYYRVRQLMPYSVPDYVILKALEVHGGRYTIFVYRFPRSRPPLGRIPPLTR